MKIKLPIVLLLLLHATQGIFAQAPDISYPASKSFVINSPITTVSAANKGGAVLPGGYGVVSTYAGADGAHVVNGPASKATFKGPNAPLVDPAGNLYVAEYGNNMIRKITPDGIVSTVAGSGATGFVNGTGTAASFNQPLGLAMDAAGNLYVADNRNFVIRKITPDGVVSTFAGDGTAGTKNGTLKTARFNGAIGMVFDKAGNMFVADQPPDFIKKISTDGIVTTFAGRTTTSGYGFEGSADGPGNLATFYEPTGLGIDPSGNLYVSDIANHLVRKITPAAVVSTLAGGKAVTTDGNGAPATFTGTYAIAVDGTGDIFVTDGLETCTVKRITPNGVITTLAGAPTNGYVDGPGAAARFGNISGFATDRANNLYITDESNARIRKLSYPGYSITPALPTGLTMDDTGNITGTPTELSPEKTYTITAYNGTGKSSATIKIAVVTSGTAVAQTITFPAVSLVTYGAADFTPAATASSGLTVAYASSNTAVATIVSGKIHITGAGTATITASQDGNTNFSAAKPVAQTLTVAPAKLTIQADNKTKNAGDNNPPLTVTFIGFVNGDSKTNLASQPVLSTTATTLSAAGDYPITASGAADANYTISYIAGTLTINPAGTAQTITFTALSGLTYGAADFTPAATASSGLTVAYASSNTAVATIVSGKIHITGAGSTSITASQDGNTTIGPAKPVAQTLTVAQAKLTIQADNKIKNTGEANPPLTATFIGLVNGDTPANLTGQPAITTTATTQSTAGDYPITVNGATAANYIVSYVAGTLTIKQVGAASPAIASINPTLAAAGTAVTITGTNFTNVTSVLFGGMPAQSFNVVSANTITAIVGAGASGDVTINSAGGTAVFHGFQFSAGQTVPPNNFKITNTSVSCKGSANGSILIEAVEPMNFIATINGPGFNAKQYAFTDKLVIDNLAAGNYSVCLTFPPDASFLQCFNSNITEPKDLGAYAAVAGKSNQVVLSLSGGASYSVALNGVTYTTTKSQLTLPLANGVNNIAVSTDRPCQGIVTQTITIADRAIPFPNPFTNIVNVNIGQDNVPSATVVIYDIANKAVFSKSYANQSGVLQIGVANLGSGLYFLQLTAGDKETIYKIIKK